MIRLHLLPLLALLAATASAQTLYFADGRVVRMSPAVRITKDSVNIPIELAGAGTGEIGLPVSSLARVDWPRPAELDAAETELKAGRPADALRKIDAILPLQQILAEVPGSWWGQAVLLRVAALARLDREIDVSVEIERLRRSPANASLVSAARIAVATVLAETGKTAQATALLSEIDRSGLPEADLARLALVEARLLRAQGRHEDALLSCLRVPVLHPAATRDLPAALLLAAECYRSLDEPARAEASLHGLVEKFPASPEAARARTLLSNNS